MHNRTLTPFFLATLLAACGGSGGTSTPAPAAPTEMALLTPADTMTWSTTADATLTLALRDPAGQAAAGASVRAYTLSRTSPQDGSALAQPVPVALLDSAVSDGAGNAVLSLRLPAHVTEVLLMASQGDTAVQQAVATADGGSALLQLAR